MKNNKKGFTLIELLITIGVLAVLATVVVLVLNPAELFRQARDTRRVNDLNTLVKAINLYTALDSNPYLAGNNGNDCQANFWASAGGAREQFAGALPQHANTGIAVDGSGWIPINFSSLSATVGSILTALPTDPINDATSAVAVDELVYKYHCEISDADCLSSPCYEINANMESAKYSNGGSNDVESTDGGTSPASTVDVYEVGNNVNK